MIWGTTVNVQTAMNVFKNFLEGFQVDGESFQSFYQRELETMR
jgi:hypothetical protein